MDTAEKIFHAVQVYLNPKYDILIDDRWIALKLQFLVTVESRVYITTELYNLTASQSSELDLENGSAASLALFCNSLPPLVNYRSRKSVQQNAVIKPTQSPEEIVIYEDIQSQHFFW